MFSQGGLASDPHLVFGGKKVIDPELAAYYGNSQGGILGEVYMAANRKERAMEVMETH